MGHLGLGKSEYTDNEVCLPQEAKTGLQLSCSLSVMNENHCRWTAFPCMQAVRRLILSAVSRGEEWRMLDAVGRQQAGTPVVSILSMQRCAVLHECGRFWMVRAEQLLTRWVAAVSLLSCAFTARHQQPKGGRKNRRRTQKAGLLPCALPSYTLHQMIHPHQPPSLCPNPISCLSLFYSHALAHCKKDTAPTLQVDSREVHA